MRKTFLLLSMTALIISAAACRIEHVRTVDDASTNSRYIEHSVRIEEIVSGYDKGVEVYHSKRPAIHPEDR